LKNKIKHIFFDLDHTLWDFERNSALALETIFRTNNIDVDINQFLKYFIPLNNQYWERYRKEEITQNQLRYGRLKDSFGALEYAISDEQIHFLSLEYVAHLPKFTHLVEGTIEILEYLKPNYQLHIITNGFQELQVAKMSNSNIVTYFQTITNSDTVGVKKPNPLIFDYALKASKALKPNCLMIGDCLEADVQGALDFGINAIFYNANNSVVPNNINHISHLLELKKYL
jgi:YjjG family noncanonical pyrimidine nucleotidase